MNEIVLRQRSYELLIKYYLVLQEKGYAPKEAYSSTEIYSMSNCAWLCKELYTEIDKFSIFEISFRIGIIEGAMKSRGLINNEEETFECLINQL
jgi:hypothetical protein